MVFGRISLTQIRRALLQHMYIYILTQVMHIVYSAFANSCPLQTDTLLFPFIHSHHVKQVLVVLRKTGTINTMYGVPPRGHLQGQTRDNSNPRFSHYKIISVVYICHIISCLKGFTLFCHIPHTYGMHMSLEIY